MPRCAGLGRWKAKTFDYFSYYLAKTDALIFSAVPSSLRARTNSRPKSSAMPIPLAVMMFPSLTTVNDGDTVVSHKRFVYDDYKQVEELDALNSNRVLKRYSWQPEAVGLDVQLTVYDVYLTRLIITIPMQTKM